MILIVMLRFAPIGDCSVETLKGALHRQAQGPGAREIQSQRTDHGTASLVANLYVNV